MESVNLNHKIKATVVSPLSIGQAKEKEWVEGIDYIRDKGILHHLNLQMMVDAGIPMEELSALYASGRIDDLRKFLIGKLEDIYDFSMAMPVGSANPVKTFYFNPITEKYVLFGSSLKGAIRSALFHGLTEDEIPTERRSGNALDQTVFGEMKNGSVFMRFIRVGDFNFDETELVNTKIYNLWKDDNDEWQGGWKHQTKHTDERFNPVGFNTVYECLMPGAVSEGSIMISPLLYRRVTAEMNFKEQKDRIMSGNSIHQLFSMINDATLDYLDREIRFFEAYPQGEHSDQILDALNSYREMARTAAKMDGRECLIKMSAGSGFHSVTGNWQYDDYTDTGFQAGKKRYKSRKIACYSGHFTPMGFLKLSVLP